ncbi:MAG TPA: lysophospholipid acyltransferase family protein [Burkholderiaceae bacterium]|nr:lysophospholipid acyltransferase family protein [Burkholderiaceae bacterium]
MLNAFRWLGRRPLWFLHALGALLGWLTYAASPTYRRRFKANARRAGFDSAQVRPAIAAAGRMIAEMPLLWTRAPDAPIRAGIEWVGAEHVVAAHAQGRGVVFLTPHMGSFEVTAQAYAEKFAATLAPVTVLYRPARKAALRTLMAGARERPGLATAPATLAGVRQMIRALRRGEAVGLLPDQVPPQGMGEWAPFFGAPAYTMTLAARLIRQTGAAPLLIWGERLARGAGFRLHVSPLGEALPGDDGAQAESAAVINRAMERLIRACPGQYLWGYNRYKSPRAADPAD